MKKYILLFCSILLLPGTLLAQAGLEISVLDADSRVPIENRIVLLENSAIGYTASTQTDSQGKARFSGLPTSGLYSVLVNEDGDFNAARVTDLRLRSNFTRSVVLLLLPIRRVELGEVTVTAETGFAEINRTNAEVSSTLYPEEMEALPVEGRDITRALYRLPNVTQATGFYPEAPNVSINGANSLFTNYMIDGMDNNENFLGGQKFPVPLGIARDVTVLTNNYSTEFGRTGNGVFNVTTRSGGNVTKGEAFYLTRPGPVIDSSSPYPQRDLSGNQVKDGFQRQQAGFGVGGALKADQTFYYVNFEQTLDFKDNLLNVPELGIEETIPGKNAFTYASARLDHRWNPNWASTLRGNLAVVGIERQGGGLDGGVAFPSAANTQDRNATLLALQNTYTGHGLVYEGNLQYSRFRWNYGRPNGDASPQVTVLGAQGTTIAVLGHPGYIFDDIENSLQLQQKLTLAKGNHTLKIGLDAISSDFALSGGGNVNGNYTVQLTAGQETALRNSGVTSDLGINDIPADVLVTNYSVELQPKSFGTRQNLVGVYLEDLVSVSPRLNVTLGIRYDYDSLSKGGGNSADLDNFAPRANFNFQLDERSSLRGGYGLFYDKIVYAIYSDALQQNSAAAGFRTQLQSLVSQGILPADTDLDRVTFDGNLTVNPQNVSYLNGPTPATVQDLRATSFSGERRILNPNGYQNPYTHQISLGYQRQVASDYLFYVDVMHSRSENLYRLRDLNAPTSYQITAEQAATLSDAQLRALVRSSDAADATRPVAPVVGGARTIVMTENGGKARYSAANVNLLKDRGADAWAFRLSYTLSRLENDTEDINFRAQDSNNFDAEWGPSINDRTHVVNAIAYVYPIQRLSLSVAALLQSGQPINRIPDATVFGTTDLNGDGRSFGDAYVGNSDRHPGEARNSDRLPWAETVDLGLQYTVPVGNRKIEVRADVFNLLNTTNLSGYSNNATQSNQIQVGPASSGVFVQRNAAPPRQFQFGIRYLF